MGWGGILTCTLFTLLIPAGLLFLRYARLHPDWTETHYSLGWYRGAERFLTSLTGPAPFSWMECFLLACGVIAILFLIGWVRETIRRRKDWWKIALKRLLILTAVGSGIFFWFVLTGEANYYRHPLAVPLKLTVEPTGKETLTELCLVLTDELNAAREGRAEDENGVFVLRDDFNTLSKKASEAVANLDTLYGTGLFMAARDTSPKPMFFSEAMSYLRLTGVIFPYLMEPNINVNQPPHGIPSTMCHELAHICGYMREDEANFIGYLAAVESGDPDFVYSGLLHAVLHATNRLYRVSPEDWKTVRVRFSPAVERDLAAHSLYWKKYDTAVGETSQKMSDAYLKANDQHDGVMSYGRMVDLLIAHYRAGGLIA